MGKFLVIDIAPWEEEGILRYLPRGLRSYLPLKEDWRGRLFGQEGVVLRAREGSSLRGRRMGERRFHRAWQEGAVCGSIGGMLQAEERRIADGTWLTAVLSVLRAEAEDSVFVTDADTPVGTAAALWLAGRVRFLSITGRRHEMLVRLAERIRQREGLAVRVTDAAEGGCVVRANGERDTRVRAEGRFISAAAAEAALLAAMPSLAAGGTFDLAALRAMRGAVRRLDIRIEERT